ncbi:MAG: OmpA family protein [Myxococcales bacterium]|nr:OmpA family protein [Myxococcales bacterium]
MPAPGPDPSSDDDGDGIAAWADLCPTQPEDFDDFDDDDGCPDPDNDGDGVPDVVDKCPLVPARRDGRDDGGCPAPQYVELAEPDVIAIEFRAGKAEVERASRPVLDALADTLAAHPEVQQVEIGGHRDPGERRGDLDVARARAVEQYLRAHGVSADRLIVRGYGDRSPRLGAGLNRRVEVRVQMAVQR